MRATALTPRFGIGSGAADMYWEAAGTGREEQTMSTRPHLNRVAAAALLSVGVAAAGVGLAAGHRAGPPRRSRAAGLLARVSARQPIRPMPLVPRRSPGPDRQSPCEPSGLGQQRLPHLLVRVSRAGQCRSEHLRGRGSTRAASTSAELDPATSAGDVLVALPSGAVSVSQVVIAGLAQVIDLLHQPGEVLVVQASQRVQVLAEYRIEIVVIQSELDTHRGTTAWSHDLRLRRAEHR